MGKKGDLQMNSTRFKGAGTESAIGRCYRFQGDYLHTTRPKKQSMKRAASSYFVELVETFTCDPLKVVDPQVLRAPLNPVELSMLINMIQKFDKSVLH